VALRLLLEGRPGSGKTTAVRLLVDRLRDGQTEVAGIVTEEIREGSRRVGFAIEDLRGGRGVMAHVDVAGPPRVGRYGVDVEAFEALALPALQRPCHVLVLDELGKMELASDRFREAVRQAFGRPVAIVATVQASRHPFVDELERESGAERMRLTRDNRDRLPGELAERLLGA
jgi:nucleoside-triphosphatase